MDEEQFNPDRGPVLIAGLAPIMGSLVWSRTYYVVVQAQDGRTRPVSDIHNGCQDRKEPPQEPMGCDWIP